MKKYRGSSMEQKEESCQDLEGHWTFAHSKELEWENAPYKTKKKAIAAGKDVFPCGFLIGQLKRKDNNLEYEIVSLEKVTFS